VSTSAPLPAAAGVRKTLARPVKTTGRVVLGPRRVGPNFARIVALVDGSGLIEIYDEAAGSWCAAGDACNFSELWSASPPASALEIASYIFQPPPDQTGGPARPRRA
jgi:hypothetical protein